jgi:hypothetical protein
MGPNALLWLLLIVTASTCLLAWCVLGVWLKGSRSTQSRKSPPSPPPIQTSDAALAQLQADQAALFSTLEKLTTTVKRLSSRNAMRERREQPAGARPPPGTPKAELLRYYGMAGKTGPAFAQAQMDLDAARVMNASESNEPN